MTPDGVTGFRVPASGSADRRCRSVGQLWAGSGSGPLFGFCSNIYFDQAKRLSLGLLCRHVSVWCRRGPRAVGGPGGESTDISGQCPDRRSGPRNRRLCRSMPVLSRYTGARTVHLTGDFAHPGRPVLRRSARDGRRPGLVRARGRAGFHIGPAPSHPGCHGGGDRGRAARRRVEDWPGAVASDTARGSGRCASGGVMPQGFPMSPRRD